MNLEVDETLRLLGLRQFQDLYVLSANFDENDQDEEEENEWQGYVNKSREFQQEETAKIQAKIKE